MLSPILICRRRRRAGEISKAYFASAQCSDSSCGDMLATSVISPLSPMKSASRGKATSSIHKQNQRGDSNISSIPLFFFKDGRCDRPRFLAAAVAATSVSMLPPLICKVIFGSADKFCGRRISKVRRGAVFCAFADSSAALALAAKNPQSIIARAIFDRRDFR